MASLSDMARGSPGSSNDSFDTLTLLLTSAGFAGIAIRCGLEVHRQRKKEAEATCPLRTGVEMRQYFMGLIFLECTVRSVALIFEAIFWNLGQCPASLECVQAQDAPRLLFLSSYSLLLLFWGQLTYQVLNVQFRSIKPTFLLGNVVVYGLHFVLTVLSFVGLTPTEFQWALALVLCVAYTVVLLFTALFGLRLAFQMRPVSRSLMCRVLGICIVCMVFGALHITFLISVLCKTPSTSLMKPDAFNYAMLEMAPAMVMSCCLTANQRKVEASNDDADSLGGVSAVITSGESKEGSRLWLAAQHGHPSPSSQPHGSIASLTNNTLAPQTTALMHHPQLTHQGNYHMSNTRFDDSPTAHLVP